MTDDNLRDLVPDDDDFYGGGGLSDDLGGEGALSGFDNPDLYGGEGSETPDAMPQFGNAGPNQTFRIGIIVLAVILVVGLVVIIFVASVNGGNNKNYQDTVTAVFGTNNAVFTQIAATATAKSWTATPSDTPVPTKTPSATPTITPSPTQTPVPTIANTLAPDITPSATPSMTNTPPSNNEMISTLGAQVNKLFGALTAIGIQQTVIAPNPNDRPATKTAKQTENAQFNGALTAISGQLTLDANILSNGAPSGSLSATPTGSASPTPSATGEGQSSSGASVTTATLAPTSASGAAQGRVYDGAAQALYIPVAAAPVRPHAQDITPGAPSEATTSPILIAVTGTSAALSTEAAQLQAAQDGLAEQLTLNALLVTGTPAPLILTENAQLEAGLQAIGLQLTTNANHQNDLGATATAVAKNPDTGLFEDLAAGRAAPESLLLFALAGIGLVALIVAARRLRVKV